jgi:hypothetical protein
LALSGDGLSTPHWGRILQGGRIPELSWRHG